MRFGHEAAAIRVDECMALASIDLLARVVATWPASFGRLDGLAVDDRTRGTRLASGPFAIEHDKGVINLLEAALITEFCKPAVAANRSAADATDSQIASHKRCH
jgi:hypothetical protein